MRAAVMARPHEVSVEDRPEPKAAGDIVKVSVLVAPMCTEYTSRQAGKLRDMLGHEAAGIVVDAADSVRVRNGDRVVVMPNYGCGTCPACNSGEHIYCANQRDVLAETGSDFGIATHAEYVLKPDWLLVPIPDDVSLRHAAMACCGLGPGFNAMERMRVDGLDTVVVAGCGPVGLGTIINGIARGARILALEINPFRADLARSIGATEVFDPTETEVADQIVALTGYGADAAVDTSGANGVVDLLLRSIHPCGRIARVADKGNATVELTSLVRRGVEFHGVWHWNHQRDAVRMWVTVRRTGPHLDSVVTHHFDLSQVSEAMDVQESGECGKVFLYPHGAGAVP
jgi:L-iditol 2-dehydrogenase